MKDVMRIDAPGAAAVFVHGDIGRVIRCEVTTEDLRTPDRGAFGIGQGGFAARAADGLVRMYESVLLEGEFHAGHPRLVRAEAAEEEFLSPFYASFRGSLRRVLCSEREASLQSILGAADDLTETGFVGFVGLGIVSAAQLRGSTLSQPTIPERRPASGSIVDPAAFPEFFSPFRPETASRSFLMTFTGCVARSDGAWGSEADATLYRTPGADAVAVSHTHALVARGLDADEDTVVSTFEACRARESGALLEAAVELARGGRPEWCIHVEPATAFETWVVGFASTRE